MWFCRCHVHLYLQSLEAASTRENAKPPGIKATRQLCEMAGFQVGQPAQDQTIKQFPGNETNEKGHLEKGEKGGCKGETTIDNRLTSCGYC
jgi:hypothetical protein